MIGKNTSLADLASSTAKAFQKKYGVAPKWIAAAPGRVNLIGEHTDYNDGFVFPMALEHYTVIAAGPAAPDQQEVQWYCERTKQSATFPVTKPVPKGEAKDWTNYIRGVFAGFQACGAKVPAINAVMNSTVPLGGGVSSSAALEVATATLLEGVTGKKLTQVEKGLLCQKAEHEYAGMPCGIMDQFISVMGKADHVLLLDCQSRKTKLVPMKSKSVAILVINTNVKHELTGSEYPDRRRQCEEAAKLLGVKSLRSCTLADVNAAPGNLSNLVFRRARHVVTEIERTTTAAEAFAEGDWKLAGELMYASHGSLRGDYEVSCPELDTVVEIAHGIGLKGGIYGCRMTGGGFGGCCVALVQSSKVNNIATKIAKAYKAKTKIAPTLFVSRPGQGATLIKG